MKARFFTAIVIVIAIAASSACSDTPPERPADTAQPPVEDAASQVITEDTVRFDTPPPPCPSDWLCDVGTCVRFTTVEAWKDKPVCVKGFACNYLTCGTGKGCWVDSPNVVCGVSTAHPDPNGDAGAPKLDAGP